MPFLFLRLGLTWGIGSKALNSGRFGRDWGLLETFQLERMHKKLTSKFRDEPFGPYEALVILLGETQARAIAKVEGMPTRSKTSEKTVDDGPGIRTYGKHKKRTIQDLDQELDADMNSSRRKWSSLPDFVEGSSADHDYDFSAMDVDFDSSLLF